VEPGLVIAGRYRLTTRLGRGGMGEVWQAEDQALRRRIAVKIVLTDRDADAVLRARLLNEARNAATLHHPNITVVHDVGEHDGLPFFVMEFLDGRDLTAILAENPRGMAIGEALALAVQVTDGLDHAHAQGVIHRDIKPANLIVSADRVVKICDFGISRYTEATAAVTGPGAVLGTPAYMAPEQYEARPADARTDLYAFGCTLYALLTGGPPFTGSLAALMRQHLAAPPRSPRLARPDIPVELDRLILDLLAKNPEYRPPSAADVAARLRTLQPGNASPRRPPAVHTPPPPTLTWHPLPDHEPSQADLTGDRDHTDLRGHTGPVTCLAFHPQRAILASGSADHTVRLWDLSGRPLAILTGHGQAVNSVAFSPDGTFLASGSADKTVRLWDPMTGTALTTLAGHISDVTAVVFRSHSGTLFSISDATIRQWDIHTGQSDVVVRTGEDITSVAYNPYSDIVAGGTSDSGAQLWNTHNGNVVADHQTYEDVTALTFDPHGDTLAIVCSWHLWLVDIDSHRSIQVRCDEPPTSLDFHPDGALLATGHAEPSYQVQLWEITRRTNKILGPAFRARRVDTLTGHADTVTSVAFSPDGTLLASGSHDTTVHLWRRTFTG
jgi:serine/threonine protein kinase